MRFARMLLTALLLMALILVPVTFGEASREPMAVAISATYGQALILLEDGTVFAAGNNMFGQLDVEQWTDIVDIATCLSHTVGLKADGTLVSAGNNDQGQCDVEGWTGIVAVACANGQTALLDSDGVVHSIGSDELGAQELDGLTHVKDIAVEGMNSAALMEDGTVKGFGGWASIDPELWQDISDIYNSDYTLVGIGRDGRIVLKTYEESCYEKDMNITGFAGNDRSGLFVHADGTVSVSGRDIYGSAEIESWTGVAAVAVGDGFSFGLRTDGAVLTSSVMGNNAACEIPEYLRPSPEALLADFPRSDKKVIALDGGGYHSLLLLEDGTVRAFGRNDYGQCDVEGWTDITAVSAGNRFSVGLRSDGTVVAAGGNSDGQCDVESWSDIVAIAAGGNFTLGLDSGGTVHAVGSNNYGQIDLDGLADVEEICAGYLFSVARMKNGSFHTCGANDYDSCILTGWSDVTALAAGDFNTLGLHPDGTVIASGRSNNGQIDVEDLKDIVALDCGTYHSVYLHADGAVTAMGKNEYGEINTEGWQGVTAVAAGDYHTLGLFADGTVLATGYNEYGQCDVPKPFVNLGDMASYSPAWNYVWDNYFYGESSDTGWPAGFVVWESKTGSTSYGENRGFMNANGWNGTVFSVNRDEDGSVSFINVIQTEHGKATENLAFFADGTYTSIDWTREPAERWLRMTDTACRQQMSGDGWYTVETLQFDDPGVEDVLPYAGFVLETSEQQNGHLHYGSYIIDVTDAAGRTFRLLDMEIDSEGSVHIAYDGHTWDFNVRTNRYTHQ